MFLRTKQAKKMAGKVRRGMAMLESLAALTIMSGAVISSAAYFGKMARTVSVENTRAVALDLINEQFEKVKTAPDYDNIESLYQGLETNIAGRSGFYRVTLVTRVSAHNKEYKIVTVVVKTPNIPKSLICYKSMIIAEYDQR